jgi:hypothetical protein
LEAMGKDQDEICRSGRYWWAELTCTGIGRIVALVARGGHVCLVNNDGWPRNVGSSSPDPVGIAAPQPL